MTFGELVQVSLTLNFIEIGDPKPIYQSPSSGQNIHPSNTLDYD